MQNSASLFCSCAVGPAKYLNLYIILNLHSMQKMLNMRWRRTPAALSHRQNIKTYRPKYTFYAKYTKYGGEG